MIPRIKNVLYATDVSTNSLYASRYAINTAQKHNAKIHILHVIEPFSPRAEVLLSMHIGEDKIQQLHAEATEKVRHEIESRIKKLAEKELKDAPEVLKLIAGIHIVNGDPATEILKKMDELDCDVLIMGTHGKGPLSYTFLGSVAEKVLRRITKPVYMIPLPKGKVDI